jgi:hypothetical protein
VDLLKESFSKEESRESMTRKNEQKKSIPHANPTWQDEAEGWSEKLSREF